MAKFYVTTPIYYINAPPHIGQAYTTLVADVLARWHRLRGDDVFFLTGLDENSVKTVEAAKERSFEDIQAYADWMAEKWREVWKILNISYDDFIRTTQERHRKKVIEFFKKVQERGDVYKGEYGGFYCEGCEGFLSESELVDGKCPLHKTVPKFIKEKNYFFRLSKYRDQILAHIEANPDFIQPEARRNEVISFLKQGLQDVSISRPGLEWGIKLPIDEHHRFWVWYEALINYMQPERYCPADIHLIAKDILRFHCIIWPGMLLSAGYELPGRIFAHGFLTAEGQKISKSLGNVVDPVYLAETYSADVLRYFLIHEISFGQDGDFSEMSLRLRLNSELADVLGNFVHRVLTFIQSRFNGEVPEGKVDAELESKARKEIDEIEELLERLKITQSIEKVIGLAGLGNGYFQSREPWGAIKTDPKRVADCLFNSVNLVKILCIVLQPFMPSTSDELAKQLNLEIKSWKQAKKFDIEPKHRIGKPKILFKKVPIQSPQEQTASVKDFKKLDIRIGNVSRAEKIPRAEKLLKLEVALAGEHRTLVAGISEDYSPEELVGKQVVVIANLKPAKLKGVKSEGMLLAAVDKGKISLLTVDKPVEPGTKVE